MSDMLNHYYCGREILQKLPDDNRFRQAALTHYDAYRFGTQGPDFLYYSVLSALVNRKSQKLAKLIHTQNTSRFFYDGLRYSLNSENPDIGLAYMAGYTTHYALDVETHPFIFCRTGKFEASQPWTRVYGYMHKMYEVLLDTAMAQYEYKEQAVYQTCEKVFQVRPETSDYLEKFYHDTALETYGFVTTPGAVTASQKAALHIVETAKDPSGIRRKIIAPVENMVGQPLAVTRLLYPVYTDELSVLNLNHETWHQPVTGQAHNESYPKLFHSAVDKGAYLLENTNSLIQKNNFTSDDILALYKNKSYLSGVGCEIEETFKYFDLFFDSPLSAQKLCG